MVSYITQFTDFQSNTDLIESDRNKIIFEDNKSQEAFFADIGPGKEILDSQRSTVSFSEKLFVSFHRSQEIDDLSLTVFVTAEKTAKVFVKKQELAQKLGIDRNELTRAIEEERLAAKIDRFIEDEDRLYPWLERIEQYAERIDPKERSDFIARRKNEVTFLSTSGRVFESINFFDVGALFSLIKIGAYSFKMIRFIEHIGHRADVYKVEDVFNKTMMVVKLAPLKEEEELEDEIEMLKTIYQDQPYDAEVIGIRGNGLPVIFAFPPFIYHAKTAQFEPSRNSSSQFGIITPFYELGDSFEFCKARQGGPRQSLKGPWIEEGIYQLLIGATQILQREILYTDVASDNILCRRDQSGTIAFCFADFGRVSCLRDYRKGKWLPHHGDHSISDEFSDIVKHLEMGDFEQAKLFFELHLVFQLGHLFGLFFNGMLTIFSSITDAQGNVTGLDIHNGVWLRSTLNQVPKTLHRWFLSLMRVDPERRPKLNKTIETFDALMSKDHPDLYRKYHSVIAGILPSVQKKDDEKKSKE